MRAQEKGGDELFIEVTEFPENSKPKVYYAPTRPSHWLSKYINNVHDVVIWKRESKGCESTDLLISLVEEDSEPWDRHDLLGSVKVKLRCENGKLTQDWEIPDPKITSIYSNSPVTYEFQGENSGYRAKFKLDFEAQ